MTAPHSAGPLGSRIDTLERRVAELRLKWEQAQGRLTAEGSAADETLKKADAQSASLRTGRIRDLEERSAQKREEIEAETARVLARIGKAFENDRDRSNDEAEDGVIRLGGEKKKAVDDGAREVNQKHVARMPEVTGALDRLGGMREEARALQEDVTSLASRLGVREAASPADAEEVGPIPTVEAEEDARALLDESRKRIAAARKGFWVRSGRFRAALLPLLGVVALAYAGGLFAVRESHPELFQTMLEYITPIAGIALLIIAILFRSWASQGGQAVIDPLHADLVEVDEIFEGWEAWLTERKRNGGLRLERDLAESASRINESFRSREAEAANVAGVRQGILKDGAAALGARVQARRERKLAGETARLESERRLLDGRLVTEGELRKEPLTKRRGEIADRQRTETEELTAAWRTLTKDFGAESVEALKKSRQTQRSWSDPGLAALKLPREFPDAVHLGELRFGWASLLVPPEGAIPLPPPPEPEPAWPLDLGFPEQGGLVIGMDPETRAGALPGFLSAILRILCSFPPGKAKFTIFDPVGLGQNFSALMHLADYDDSLVGGRIWTETVHIERKLAETTEHIEKVIQKYLRNKYASIDAYNREVREMAEPYRFVVISDFPTAFSEIALERLASILTSGARCGVHPVILWDRSQKLPAMIDPARMRAAALVLRAIKDGFQAEDEPLKRGRLAIEPPPAPEALTALLHAVGKQCAAAERVEIPFQAVAPKDGRLWTESAEGGIRIPLGRAGADRLQYLDLGKGTAQHALIAGKTGSGKSTLFHVMVASAATWYSPREIELYLIDFKKGVEFKTYATNRLPHARAVAIESDREFGLSVLRRLDKELGDRAERFRNAGVQDFAGYRRAAPKDPLPRTLLLIDEFQEFFTEEDGIAQEAALLLDRIVRQGRAFGVHVVLGSQTLGGSYTLARATLGQMAVRIALQCNEADSYLILNDENAAARLLSRPGEAIYNDRAGMLEGNNPFQVAWLPDEVRDRFLRDARDRAAAEGLGAREPMVVFEGNVPADIANNVPLKERIAHPVTVKPEKDAGVSAWIGEANAIKGPTEVRFTNQAGSNLLVVGQQRESALSVVTAAAVSIAAAYPGGGARFVILDGSPPELAYGRRPAELKQLLPGRVDLVEYADVAAAMEELAIEVEGRREGTRKAGARIFLLIFDLQRFRQIRQSNDFDLSGGGDGKPTPDKRFADILVDGPAHKVHTVLWSDSLGGLNRSLSRKSMAEFQMRVLFQMSASDSSELIDSPVAGKLGLHRGLLFLEEHGTVEKFRPYSLLDAEASAALRKSLSGPP